MNRLLFIMVMILQCNLLWAVKPLPEGIPTETEPVEEEVLPEVGTELKEEPPPPEIQRAIELEKQDREEVIQRKREEELREAKEVSKRFIPRKPIPVHKSASEGPSLPVIITALVILLFSFFIYRKK